MKDEVADPPPSSNPQSAIRNPQFTTPRVRPRFALLSVAFVAFVSLGLPDAVLGVAWPSIKSTFGLQHSQLGLLLAASMTGYLASSFSGGSLVARFGVGRVLLGSSVLMVVAVVCYAAAPAWPAMVAVGLLAGAGGGAVDAGINAYAAAHFSPRVVNWLHACYGIGATLGPLLMTAVLASELSWRWGYVLIGLILATTAVAFLFTLNLWTMNAPEPPRIFAPSAEPAGVPPVLSYASNADEPIGIVDTLRRPAVWLGIGVFFLYTGLEVVAGQWSYSLFTEGRGVAPATAGVAVGAYWASLAAGRVTFGAAAARVPPGVLVRVGLCGAPMGALLVWFDWSRPASFFGLALLGFSLAPIFPLLIAGTPARLGRAYAAHAIGFQVSAATLGAAALPGAAGVLVRWNDLEVIGPYLFAVSVGLLVLHEIMARSARRGWRGAAGLCAP